ncbi:calcium-dependent protein kinase 26-like [Tripterygium wilfordii]|uniref:non-specific serine/threonine protein kinase n=1 Tax=Tripterygium wilfordii TaxID=458696 RepID=A0A7J7C739_TRIWF|nr:calcium-dependent protein kinase 26 [Tripterygium wilfordii]XP_038687088.1 calcium-dependent protein kinase 26 [Tripterygium wilfordii]KAF5729941.1 calcium-dependent protein kinase 26-like [Tripterygium wilfordii]
MDVAGSDNNSHPWTRVCNCYKVSILKDTLLDCTHIADLRDQYVLGEQLGWGQFGVIRTCSDKFTGEILACKSITKDRLVTPEDVRSVKLEIEIMIRLSGHPNVVNLKAVYEDDDYVHLLMELCAGGELFHRLEKHGRFSEYDAGVIFRQLMQVVLYCHEKGIVHRDLKPENILLANKSLLSPIKLADFGLATYIKPGGNLHGTVGSPFYIAPEVLAGDYNQAADVWSAGVILYILLSGMPPFWGKTKSRIFDSVRAADLQFPSDPWDKISASAKDLITGMLCVDPSKRLTAAQVLAHSWMVDCKQAAQEPYRQDILECRQLEVGGGSFSTPLISRNRDYSFSYGSPATGESQQGQYPTFTCKSSFSSSFLVDNSTPCPSPGGFSFSNCGSSDTTKFSYPIPSMPSFNFFSPCSAADQESISLRYNANLSAVETIPGESSLEKLLILQDFAPPLKGETGEMDHGTAARRGGNNGSRVSGIHGKRNHTIGLGERDHLDIIVTESIIRWASCTHIPTAPSLRLSLVF